VLGANTARQIVEKGLLDEIVIHLAPTLLGDGVRLFENPGGDSVELEPIEVVQSGRLTDLRFNVVTLAPALDPALGDFQGGGRTPTVLAAVRRRGRAFVSVPPRRSP